MTDKREKNEKQVVTGFEGESGPQAAPVTYAASALSDVIQEGGRG